MIKEFSGIYKFLSNFWPCEVELDGKIYPSVEHAYQAAKTLVEDDREKIKNTERPEQAKKLGKKLSIRPDWDKVKVEIMKDLVRQKFKDPDLKIFLLETNYDYIQEGNNWGDKFWGVDLKTGKGDNMLGKILMKVRDELRTTN